MSNRFFSQIFIFQLMLFLLIALPSTGVTGQMKHPKINELAPSFTLEDLQGKKVSLKDFRGKFVVIHFATSW